MLLQYTIIYINHYAFPMRGPILSDFISSASSAELPVIVALVLEKLPK